MRDANIPSPRLIANAKEFCRELRKNQTNAEKVFWENVRYRRLFGRKFYRQYPIFIPDYDRDSFFVADFFCHERKLVVEIEGKVHDFQKDYDAMRTHLINERGIKVVRFKNAEIQLHLDTVIKKLEELLK